MENYSYKYNLPTHFVNCEICMQDDFTNLHRIRSLNIVKCNNCGFIYTNPVLDWNYVNQINDIVDRVDEYEKYYYKLLKPEHKRFLNKIETYRKTGRLLDYGSGFGHFLGMAKKQSWECVGLEIDSQASKWSKNRFSVDVYESVSIKKSFQNSFDVITLWDVIEHVKNPTAVINECYSFLRPGGLLYLRTPNASGLLIEKTLINHVFLKIYWNLVYPAMPYEHIYHFQIGIIKKILSENYFKIIKANEIKFPANNYIGRNIIVKVCRNIAGRLANNLDMPYEMEIYSEKLNKK